MVHPRDRHLESQNRASANTRAIASSDTRIASTLSYGSNANDKSRKSNAADTQSVTLDKLHTSHLEKIDNEYRRVSDMKACLANLKTRRGELDQQGLVNLSPHEMHDMFSLETQIEELNTTIQSIQSDTKLTDYFMNTGDILYEYYDNLQSISKGNDARRKVRIDSYSAETDVTRRQKDGD